MARCVVNAVDQRRRKSGAAQYGSADGARHHTQRDAETGCGDRRRCGGQVLRHCEGVALGEHPAVGGGQSERDESLHETEANTADPPPTASADRADDRDGKRRRHTEPGCDGMFEVVAGENNDAGRPQPRAPAGDGERAMEAEFGREEQARARAGVGHDERDSYA